MAAIAALLEIGIDQLWTIVVVGAVLIAGWLVLRAVLRVASRLFALGCLSILALVVILYLAYALL